MDCREDRISPLRGLSHEDIVRQTMVVRNGLSSLRDDHYNILGRIREEFENGRNANDKSELPKSTPSTGKRSSGGLLEERINNVTRSLEQLEVGIEESSVLLSLSDHFQRLEADRSTLRLEMGRVQDENEWLREELSDTQRQLQEALVELADLREEKTKWDFEEELRNVSESNVRPITPSKIPVGAWRVEEEKDINRALNGGGGGTRSSSPAPTAAPSRIPVGGWRTRLPAYKSVMEKESLKTVEASKRQYFNLHSSAAAAASVGTSRSKIPSR